MQFYMTNLTKKQEKKVKEYIEDHNLGKAELSNTSILIKTNSEINKKKIKSFADRLVYEESEGN